MLDAVCGSETSVTPSVTNQGYIPGDLSVKTNKIKGKVKGKVHPVTSHEDIGLVYRYRSTLS